MFNYIKRRISLFWTLQIIGWTGYALDRLFSEFKFFPAVFIYILVAFSLTLVMRPVYRWLWARSPSLVRVAVVAVLCSVAAGFLWLLVSDQIFFLLGIRQPKGVALSSYLADTMRYSLTHHKPFLFLSWSTLYFGFKYWQKVEHEKERALRADALAHEAQLNLLRYQINPHFLFNALNSIRALVRENPERSEMMISELSEFLRYSLAQHRPHEATLKDEVEAIRNYLAIEKIRFEDKLDVRFDIDPEAEHFFVPGFLIHPLVENAIKYGMQTSAMPLRVELSARARGDSLRIEVANSGRWADHASGLNLSNGTGIGIENVRQRLEQVYPGRHSFDVTEGDGSVRAVIEIELSGTEALHAATI
ncbi:MAG TPA: histidine kinase [Blastocatellia bacterium]|nr:histidine kinase [Blastocatellia bacterium]